jgi:hypothetical protein
MKLDSIGALFAKSWKRYQERFGVVVMIFLLPLALIGIGDVLIAQQTTTAAALGALLCLIGGIISIAASVAMVAAIGKGEDFFAAYNTGFKLFWASIWIGILVGLAYFGGIILLVIPGIILAVQLAFVQYVLVIENNTGMMALAQSREYIKGYWWAFVGRGLLLGLISIAAILVIYLPVQLIFGGIVGILAYGIILLLLTPFSVVYSYEIFDNLRRMKPDAAAAAAKAETGFLKVCMVFGVIGFVGILLAIFAAIAFSPQSDNHQYAYPPATDMATGTN